MTIYLLALHGQGLRRLPGSARLGSAPAWLGLTWLNRSLFTAATQAISGAALKWPLWEFQSLLAPIFSLPIDEFAD